MFLTEVPPPSTQTLFKESFAHIYYQANDRILVVKWIGFLRLEDTQRACRVLLNFVKSEGIQSLFCEQTELKVLSQKVHMFLVNECFPAAEQYGLRKIAILSAEDVFAQASVTKVNNEVLDTLQIESFSSASQASKWLKAR